MKVHVFSRSRWDEPHRIRQQLATLLLSEYEVEYHSPRLKSSDQDLNVLPGMQMKRFAFFSRFSSLPLVSLVNAFFLYLHLKKNVKSGDIVFNFLPELMWISGRKELKLIAVLNDDFASMAPSISAWWIKSILKRMAAKADAALYVSTLLQSRYPCAKEILFYPWADPDHISDYSTSGRHIVLYWGYISSHLDLVQIEMMAKQIFDFSLSLEIHLIGPIEPSTAEVVRGLAQSFSCVKYFPPRNINSSSMKDVLFGIELLSPEFKNSEVVEVPNKAPRLLAYGVPLVFSGCTLLKEPYFIKYDGDLRALLSDLKRNSKSIGNAIEGYFLTNNSAARLRQIKELIRALENSGA